eukprot:scaffold54641_cov48-Phaeocystis_antarctica.AAC.2
MSACSAVSRRSFNPLQTCGVPPRDVAHGAAAPVPELPRRAAAAAAFTPHMRGAAAATGRRRLAHAAAHVCAAHVNALRSRA